MAHWTDIKVSALGSRVGWTPARNNDRRRIGKSEIEETTIPWTGGGWLFVNLV